MLEKIKAEKQKLSTKIQSITEKLSEVQAGIQQAIQKKASAKENHERYFDAGDEQAMSKCLADIRSSNTERQALVSRLSDYGAEISELRSEWKTLIQQARAERDTAEQKVKTVQDEFSLAKDACNAVHGILDLLNTLERKLSEIQGRYASEKVNSTTHE